MVSMVSRVAPEVNEWPRGGTPAVSHDRRLPQPKVTVFRPQRTGVRAVLGDLEAAIMEIVWARSRGRGLTVRNVLTILRRRRAVAYTTVMTTMARLAKKKLLRAEKDGQAYLYRPTAAKEEFVSGVVDRIIHGLLAGFTTVTRERLQALAGPRATARASRCPVAKHHGKASGARRH